MKNQHLRFNILVDQQMEQILAANKRVLKNVKIATPQRTGKQGELQRLIYHLEISSYLGTIQMVGTKYKIEINQISMKSPIKVIIQTITGSNLLDQKVYPNK